CCIVDISCGAWHTLLLTLGGRVLSFGDGFTGQLGLQDRGNKSESRCFLPRLVTVGGSGGSGAAGATRSSSGGGGGVRVTQVACGSFTSAALSWDGCLYQWGVAHAFSEKEPVSNPEELLPRRAAVAWGNGHQPSPLSPPPTTPKFSHVALGSYVTVGVTAPGEGQDTG
ncbi:unnamed protein product, partial [Discosporangium mesarthrocarpum]